jgi:hypothetical protein
MTATIVRTEGNDFIPGNADVDVVDGLGGSIRLRLPPGTMWFAEQRVTILSSSV